MSEVKQENTILSKESNTTEMSSDDNDEDEYSDEEEDDGYNSWVDNSTVEVKGFAQQEQKRTEGVPPDKHIRADMAVMLKDQGNGFFKKGNVEAALKCYLSAITHDCENVHLYLNIAACFLKLGKYEDAFKNSNTALKLSKGKLSKGWFRRGMAFFNLRDYDNAYYDFLEAHILEPHDIKITREWKLAEQKQKHETKELMARDFRKDQSYWFDQLRHDMKEVILSGSKEIHLSSQPSKLPNPACPDHHLTAMLWLLRTSKTTTTLSISNQLITKRTALALNALLEVNKNISHLDLTQTFLGAANLRVLVQTLCDYKNLQTLKLDKCYLRKYGAEYVQRILKQNSSIKELSLRNNSFRDPGMMAICSGLLENIGLEKLDVSENDFCDDSAIKLKEVFINTPKLREIRLADNPITLDTVFKLTQTVFNDCPHIKLLDLSGVYIVENIRNQLLKQAEEKGIELILKSVEKLNMVRVGSDFF